eukprot:TRINITY_DN22901_c0_g1_i1.p1 TRINITY_DN22901_c0_g1~~TRINITY_DN22901_c0_g1_i1.p1  ORF type:complete len:277 (+),score=55.36 TRINITY_DN22901_c0_g1_i1:58-831(+)
MVAEGLDVARNAGEPQIAEHAVPSSNYSAIHGVDQRAPIVTLEDVQLPGGCLRLEQRGANMEGFSKTTSSVIWGSARRMSHWLLRNPKLVRGKHVIEVGSGIGLVGATAAAMGAASVVLTDCQEALPLLTRNSELLLEQGVRNVDVARLDWGNRDDEAAIFMLPGCGGGFDLILACDVILAGWDVTGLVQSSARLLRHGCESRLLLGFEFREDWGTIGGFLQDTAELGLEEQFVTLGEDGIEDDEEDEFFLYTLSWR